MLPVRRLHLSDDRGDGRGVDVRSFHEGARKGDVVGVDRLEKVVELADGGELFEDEGAFEIRFVHGVTSGGISASRPCAIEVWTS